MDSEVRKTLEGARSVLLEHGHTKNVLVDREGRVCLRGAIFSAVHGYHRMVNWDIPWGSASLVTAAEKALGFPDNHATIETMSVLPQWNNRAETTLDDILDLFAKALGEDVPAVPVEREAVLA